jgi:phospholipase/carboxylesterase
MRAISEEIVHVNGHPKKIIIFLHGYIDNCEGLNKRIVSLLNKMDDVAIHLPEAPVECEIYSGKRQWYSMHDFDPNDDRKTVPTLDECTEIYAKMSKGFDCSYRVLSEYIENCLNEYQLDAKDVILCGFSQGAMVAIYTALMQEEKIGGCISFSGIITPHTFLQKHTQSKPDMLLIHGNADNLVRFEAQRFTKEQLTKIGCNVQTYVVPEGQHRVSEDGLLQATNFIKQRTTKKLAI